MRLVCVVAAAAACSSAGTPPSDPKNLLGSWQDVLPLYWRMELPAPQPVDEPHSFITFGSDGTYVQTGSAGATATGTYTADAYDVIFDGASSVAYTAIPGELMLGRSLAPDGLAADGVTGSWTGDGDVELGANGTATGSEPGVAAIVSDAEGYDVAWELFDGVHVFVWTQPGNLIDGLDLEVVPGRALGGTLYTPM